MVDNVGLSLDEIISKTRGSRGGRNRGAARGFGGGGGGSNTRRGNAGGRGSSRNSRTPLNARRNQNLRSAYSRSTGDIDGRWQHDMFDGYGGRAATRSSQMASGPTKLLVSNLEFGVSDSDVTELFAEFGPLKSAAVHYDRSGRSLGTADVIFERRPDAIKAMKQYNGVPLDGRPMDILLATPEVATVAGRPAQQRLGGGGRGAGNVRQGRVQRPGRTGFQSGRGGGRRGGAGRTNARNTGKTMTAEELDAELDAYNATK